MKTQYVHSMRFFFNITKGSNYSAIILAFRLINARSSSLHGEYQAKPPAPSLCCLTVLFPSLFLLPAFTLPFPSLSNPPFSFALTHCSLPTPPPQIRNILLPNILLPPSPSFLPPPLSLPPPSPLWELPRKNSANQLHSLGRHSVVASRRIRARHSVAEQRGRGEGDALLPPGYSAATSL